MKPFFGIDLTADRKNTQPHGKEFLTHTPSCMLSKHMESLTDQAETAVNRSKLPLPIRIIQYICGLAALISAAGILRSNVSLAEGYRNAPWIHWSGGVCLVIWFILWIWGKQKSKTVLASEDSTRVFSNLTSVSHSVYTELAVPADAREVDILSFYYKAKGESIKPCLKGMQFAQYLNSEFRIFSDSENLYLANLEGKYTFPLSSVVSLRTVKKHIRIAGWNKKESYDSRTYQQYKLTRDQYGCIHCKCYHILELRHNGELFGIYIPSYELPVFEALTGRKAQPE